MVLRGCSLALEAGQNAVIVGPSGSGKSTFLYIVGTLDRPRGSVSLAGQNPFALDEPRWPPFATSESASSSKITTCYRNARCWKTSWCRRWRAATLGGIDRPRPRAAGACGLGARLDIGRRNFGRRRQRAAVARPCSQAPAGAGRRTNRQSRPHQRRGVGDLLLEMQQQEGTMLIVVTHSLELARRFTHQYELDDGHLKQVELVA